MKPPDVTTDPAEWEKIRSGNSPLWKNLVHQDVFSTDGGKTFTVSTTRECPEEPREVYPSRKVSNE